MNPKRIAFLPLAGVIVVLDQWGKHYAMRTIEIGERVPLFGDLLALAHAPAASGAFGFFRDWAPAAQLLAFGLLSTAASVVLISFYRGLTPREHGSAAALGAILGGIASNTVDRIRYGFGIDFLHLGSATSDTLPDTNLADIAIVLGVTTLIVELLATEMAARAAERKRP
jgi:signal peptidase II